MATKLGIDQLLTDKKLLSLLKGKRVGLLGHPASVTSDLIPTIDALLKNKNISLVAAFGPQHGMRGEKQDNMVESKNYRDPYTDIPVFSLYGDVRRPTAEMMNAIDILLVDLQDVGTRIYTFLTTVLYVLEAGAKYNKSIWVLDRPNPAGRPVEGNILQSGWESFVGAGPLPIRHGLTLGEAANWFKSYFNIDVDLRVIKMRGYNPKLKPGFGWPELSWVNPSPNASNLSMARCFAGTVLIEGTHLSEGRGTTRPLEVIGAPDIKVLEILKQMERLEPKWMRGCRLRPCYFEPTFQKHKGVICEGLQIHVDDKSYRHNEFTPFRLVILFLKSLRMLSPEYQIWRDFHYEYEKDRLAFDLICGSDIIRKWIDDPTAKPKDLEKILVADEKKWIRETKKFHLYP